MSWTHPEKKAVSRQISDALVTQLPSSSRTVQEVKYLTKETRAYRKSIYGIFKATAEVYPIRNAAGSAAKSGIDKVISYISMTRKRRCMGYKQSYNPRTRTNSRTPVWTYY